MGHDSDTHSGQPSRTHRGGCDCGAVRYELELAAGVGETLAPAALSLRASRFKLLTGEDCVSGHQFASWSVHHFYCERCGVCSFSRHEVGNEAAAFYAVDLRCLDLPRRCYGC